MTMVQNKGPNSRPPCGDSLPDLTNRTGAPQPSCRAGGVSHAFDNACGNDSFATTLFSTRTMWLLAAGLSFLVWGMVGVVTGPLLPETIEDFALTGTQAGLVFFVWSGAFSAGSFMSKPLLAHMSPTVLLIAMTAAAAAMSLALFASDRFAIYAAAFALLGGAGGATFTVTHTLIGQTFTHRRVAALGLLDVVFSAGNLLAPVLVVALLAWGIDWQMPFALLAAFFMGLALLFAALGRMAPKDAGASNPAGDGHRIGKAGRARGLGALAAASFSLGWLEWGHNVWLVTFAIDTGRADHLARLGHATFLAGMITARLGAIALNDRMHTPWALRTLFALVIGGSLSVSHVHMDTAYLIGTFALGAGMGALFPIFLGRAMDIDPSRSSTFSVIMIVSLSTGGQFASLVIGALSDALGVTTAFLINGAFVILLVASFEAFRRGNAA
ncbi:MFS transporter [Kushneria sp. AK178]